MSRIFHVLQRAIFFFIQSTSRINFLMLQQFFPSERDYNAGFFLRSDQLLQDFFFYENFACRDFFFQNTRFFIRTTRLKFDQNFRTT